MALSRRGGAGTRPSGAVLSAVLLAAMAAGCAGPAPRGTMSTPPGTGPPAGPPPVSFLRAPPREPMERLVRVLLSGVGRELLVSGSPVRAWDAGGSLVSESDVPVKLSALGSRVLWRPAEGTGTGGRAPRRAAARREGAVLDSPLDVGSAGSLRVDGNRLPGRIRITVRGGKLSAVAVVPLEEYVAAVVSRETPSSFGPEALAAVAVAARTYAMVALEKPRDPSYDVTDTVQDQVFDGMDGADGPFRDAARATRGEILVYGGSLARAVYHSTCGGSTESAEGAWGEDVPYLRPVACDDCLHSPVRRWEDRMGAAEGRRVALALGVRAGPDLAIEIVGRTTTGRAVRIRLSSGGVSRETAASAFRQAAGYAKVRSLRMRIAPKRAGWLIEGEGYGHGVGMCQWGADGMARRGKRHREILARYYPGTSVAGGAAP